MNYCIMNINLKEAIMNTVTFIYNWKITNKKTAEPNTSVFFQRLPVVRQMFTVPSSPLSFRISLQQQASSAVRPRTTRGY